MKIRLFMKTSLCGTLETFFSSGKTPIHVTMIYIDNKTTLKEVKKRSQKHITSWMHDVNWMYVARSEDILYIFWKSNEGSIYVPCPGGNTFYFHKSSSNLKIQYPEGVPVKKSKGKNIFEILLKNKRFPFKTAKQSDASEELLYDAI